VVAGSMAPVVDERPRPPNRAIARANQQRDWVMHADDRGLYGALFAGFDVRQGAAATLKQITAVANCRANASAGLGGAATRY
jgi:hypothetical protein